MKDEVRNIDVNMVLTRFANDVQESQKAKNPFTLTPANISPSDLFIARLAISEYASSTRRVARSSDDFWDALARVAAKLVAWSQNEPAWMIPGLV